MNPTYMHALSWGYIKDKWSHTGFQKYFQNTSWMFAGQVANIVSLFINIWIARYLGPENFGHLSFIFAFVGIFSAISNLGLNDVLIRDLVRYPEKRDIYLGTSAWLLSLGGVTAFILVVTSAFIFEPAGMIRTLIVVAGLTTLFSAQNVIPAYFQARVEAKKNSIAQIVGVITVSLIKIYFILSGKGIIWFTFAFVLDFIFGLVLYTLNYKLSGLKFSDWKFDKSVAKELFSNSYLLMLSSVAGYLLLRVDQVMINSYLDGVATGLYAAAVRLSEIWYFIPSIITASLFPAIVNAHKMSSELYHRRLEKLYLFLLLSGLIIAIPTTILAPLIIKILYGSAYIAAIPILQIYIWSGVGLFLNTGLIKYLLTENKPEAIFTLNIFSVLINIGLNMLLIPMMGLTGAAWSTLIAYIVSPLFIVGILLKKRNA